MVKLTIEKTDDFQAVRCSIKQEQHISSYTQTVFTTTRFTSNQKKKKKKKASRATKRHTVTSAGRLYKPKDNTGNGILFHQFRRLLYVTRITEHPKTRG